MITTRTRILSILATVAMLVSMLACFVIPASADESVTAPYQALIEDVGADKVPYLAAVIETATDDATLAAELAKDVAAGTIVWPTWAYGEADYPRYAYKAVYDAAGYNSTENANVWSISAPADWTAMVAASVHDTANPDDTETFAGYTFHVTQDVDFENVDMYPLSLGDGKYYVAPGAFQGTIQGHNHAFKRISVIDPLTTTTGNRIIGMIGKLGDGAVIENFGVDSGTISTSTTCTRSSASTFGVGCPSALTATAPVLHNVWSGADISVSGSTNDGAKYAGGILGISADNKGLATVNGAYFFGTLTADVTYGILYNIRTGAVYNALSNLNTVQAISLNSNATASMFKNIYSVGANPVNIGTSNKNGVTEATVTENKCGNAASVEVGAWEINKANAVAAVADGVDKVFFTITGKDAEGNNILRPTGKADGTDRIVKVTVGDVTDPLYVNLDTTELTKEYLVELTGNDAITGYSLDGGTTPVLFDETNTHVVLPGDEATITLEVNADGELEEIKTQYSNLLAYSDYLTDEAITAIGTFVANATVATLESDEATLLSALKTYSTYPAEGDKKVPGYKEVETLGAYNEANVWTINSTEDWLKMVADSKCESETELGKTFENHIFYVTRDINFEGITMKPLNFGSAGGKDNDSTCPFQGTINGNGYAFKNITVEEEVDSTSNTSVGMIGKLGNKARINNFGVDSGDIVITSVEGYEKALYVSTFGDPVTKEATCRLNKVWSGATIKADSTGTNHAAGIMARGRDSAVIINGAYFFGTLEATNMYGVFIDMKAGEAVYNSLSASKTTGTAMILHSVTGTAINNANVGSDPISTVDGATGTVEKNVNATSALEGAWTINSNQPAADGVAEVFYTLKENGDIRFGDETNKIVKVSVNNDEKAIYVNNGTTLNKAYFADLYEVGANAIIINDDASIAEVTANGDTAVAITVDYAAELANVRDEYDDLLAIHLTDAAADALNTFLTSTDDAQTVLATEGALITALTGGVYTTYPAEGGKAVPGYKDVELYGAYNTAHVWTINEPADWLKMVADSNAETAETPNTFRGYTFYVTDNIDFSTITEMTPLNYSTGAQDNTTCPFQGTIEGNNFAFRNVNVLFETEGSGTFVAGLIGKLGNRAKIKNFGVDSGLIKGTGTSGNVFVSTFGEPLHTDSGQNTLEDGETLATVHAKLEKVWSGATIEAVSETGSTRSVGIAASGQNAYTYINGAYFFGTLKENTYAVGIFQHIQRASIYNVLSDPKIVGDPETLAMFISHASATALDNVYSVDPIPVEHTAGTFTGIGDNDMVSSAAEGAWEINGKQDAEDENAVYFTIVGEDEDGNPIIRPNGTVDNQIVQVKVVDDKSKETFGYINKGEFIDKEYVADLLGLTTVTAITSATIGGSDMGSYEVTADTTIDVVLDTAGALQAQLKDYVDQYEGLETSYFKTTDEINEAGKVGLAQWLEWATSSDETALNNAIDAVTTKTNYTLVDEITTDYQRVPAYKLHATYGDYQPTVANWLIEDPEDWDAMDDYVTANEADTDNSPYFANTIFHLKADVDFDGVKDMMPLGVKTTRKMAFAGTIDGHGFGFENVDIYGDGDGNLVGTSFVSDDGYLKESIGLIGFLGNGSTIQNFGVNSGTIHADSGNAGVSVSTFGTVAAGETANFSKVWSGATLSGASNPFVSALVGLDTSDTDSKVTVDGFTFYGKASKGGTKYLYLYGIMGGVSVAPAAGSSFTNIITYPTTQGNRYTYLFGGGLTNGLDSASYTTGNIYGIKKADTTVEGIGFEYDYRTGTGNATYTGNDPDQNVWVQEITAYEAALEVNTTKNTGVYFKLAEDGSIRPTDKADDYLVKVKVTIDGTEGDYYLNLGQVYTLADLSAALGLSKKAITAVTDTTDVTYVEATSLTVTANGASFTITTEDCDHAGYITHIDGEEKHTIDCSVCGYVGTEKCTIEYQETNEVVNNTITSTGSCSVCGYDQYSKTCTGTVKNDDQDCTTADVLEFTCGCSHHDSEVSLNNVKSHDFSGEPIIDDTIHLRYYKCENDGCAAKSGCVYEVGMGVVDPENIEMAAAAAGSTYDVTVTLPDNLATATLTFTFTDAENYAILKVMQGATELVANEGKYTVTGNESVVVTVQATLAAAGGNLTVAMTDATASPAPDGAVGGVATIADNNKEIVIQFIEKKGDVDGSGEVDLGDALDALYFIAQLAGDGSATGEPIVINEANADFDNTPGFDINDVYAIVQHWLGERIKQLIGSN